MRVARYLGWPAVAAFGSGIFYRRPTARFTTPFNTPDGYWAAQEKIGARDVWLKAADGVKLHAWWSGSARLVRSPRFSCTAMLAT